jgi:hypothetical protein
MAAGKGWYRYRILYGATLKGEHYDVEMVLHKTGKKGLVDFSKEEAEAILKQIGNYMANDADYKNLREDF